MSNLLNRAIAVLLVVPITLVLAPVLLLVAIIDRTNPMFIQERLGQFEKPFDVFKVRTMLRSTGDVPTHKVAKDAVTPLGRFLRKFKIDELPQIYNVLNGTMNFVGPRPGLAKQVELTQARRQLGVFNIRPGITGLAQVQGLDMSNPELLADVDAEYMRTRSFILDVKLMTETITGGALNAEDGAVSKKVSSQTDDD